MLIATPYRDFDVRDKSPPKVISEIRKSYFNCGVPNLRPKLSGDLLVKCGTERNWWPRRVQIRGGQLHVSGGHPEDGPPSIRLSLRHLSLQAGSLPNSLSLCRGQNIVLMLQTASERAFDEWVKTIAIELIRQTPLDAIKYLDILTIAECWKRKVENYEKDWNFNNVEESTTSCETCAHSHHTEPSKKDNVISDIVIVKEKDVEDLLKKCQNVENYVPVKDKLFLFESLCKLDRKVRSTEDVSLKVETPANKRARSLHDLSNLNTHIAVREICKYFENKTENDTNNAKKVVNFKTKRLVNSDSSLSNVYKFRKVITT